MAENAYTLFFLVVLFGSLLALYITVQPDWARVVAALRREAVKDPSFAEVVEPPSFMERLEPRLERVEISICRL
jgi:hypothetical protein